MTTTCEHGRERATCPECGVTSKPLLSAIEAARERDEEKARKAIAEMALGDDPTPEQLAQFMREYGDPSSEWLHRNQKAMAERRRAEGGTRPLTDVEEQWVRMKHPEMSQEELDTLIAEGLPADVAPITRADLQEATPENEPHAFARVEWERRKKARKASAASRKRNRVKKHRNQKHAKKR